MKTFLIMLPYLLLNLHNISRLNLTSNYIRYFMGLDVKVAGETYVNESYIICCHLFLVVFMIILYVCILWSKIIIINETVKMK